MPFFCRWFRYSMISFSLHCSGSVLSFCKNLIKSIVVIHFYRCFAQFPILLIILRFEYNSFFNRIIMYIIYFLLDDIIAPQFNRIVIMSPKLILLNIGRFLSFFTEIIQKVILSCFPSDSLECFLRWIDW